MSQTQDTVTPPDRASTLRETLSRRLSETLHDVIAREGVIREMLHGGGTADDVHDIQVGIFTGLVDFTMYAIAMLETASQKRPGELAGHYVHAMRTFLVDGVLEQRAARAQRHRGEH